MSQTSPSRRRPRPPRKQPISITLDPALLAQIDARGVNRSEVIRRDLAAYYATVHAAPTTKGARHA